MHKLSTPPGPPPPHPVILSARFDFSKAPEKDRAPKDPTVKIVGMPGQTRGSIGVVYEMEAEGGGVERVAFTGGSVGLPSYLEVSMQQKK